MSILGNAPRTPIEWGCDSLDALPRSTRRALRLAADESVLWPGQAAILQGSAVQWLFIVVSGELALRRDGRDLRVLGPGATFGALESLARQHHADGDLVARDISRVLTVPKRAYTALVATEPAFGEWVMRTLAAQYEDTATR